MNDRNIEDTLRPETVNEVLLLNRIRQLKIAGYEDGRLPDWRSPFPEEVAVQDFTPELRIGASVKAEWAGDPHIRVRARTFDPTSLGYAYYVSKETLARTSPREAASLLGELNDRLVRDLAKYLEAGKLL